MGKDFRNQVYMLTQFQKSSSKILSSYQVSLSVQLLFLMWDQIRKGSKRQNEFRRDLMNNGKPIRVPQQGRNMKWEKHFKGIN